MIFVTVGSGNFDELIEAMDRYAAGSEEEVIAQIGIGKYEPTHMRWFRFAPSLDPYYRQARLVVAHGGVGVTMETLNRGLPLVSVNNPDRPDGHQDDLLGYLSEEGYLLWCRQLSDLPKMLACVDQTPLRRYQPPPCRIGDIVDEYLQSLG